MATGGDIRANDRGFTIVEILIAIVVLAILASIVTLSYRGIQRRSAEAVLATSLKQAGEEMGTIQVMDRKAFREIDVLPDSVRVSSDVELTFHPASNDPVYSGLSAVQNGVLFYEVCEELIADEYYSLINPRDGGTPQSVVMRCDDNIHAGGLLITGWQSRTWSVPLQKATLEDYIASVPYDSWWIDRQDVVRGFYQELIDRFERRGGQFPVQSFWDPRANQWSGVPKQSQPAPKVDPLREGDFCIEGYHERYPDELQHINQAGEVASGGC